MADDLPRGSEPIVTDPPAIDISNVSKLLENAFGKRGTVSELGGERDRNFLVGSKGGERFVLKLSNPADGRGVLDFQTKALRHIQRSDADLPVMELVRTTDGSPWTTVEENDETYFVRLFTFVRGRRASFENLDPDALSAYGAVVARMGKALRGFFHPEARYEILWDLRYTSEFRSLVDEIDDDARRDIVEEVLDRFETRVEPDFDMLRAQVIHTDLGPDNVLFDTNERVSGITDFGDLTYTALICDLAVVLANVMNRHEMPITAAQSVIEGYASVTPLEETERRLLPDLVLARLTTRAIMHAWRSEKYEHNTDDVTDLWDSLATFLYEVGPEVLKRRFRSAALGPVPYSRIETSELVSRRQRTLGSAWLSYADPVHFVAGEGVWLFDPDGRRYLDAYNNVPVVGHANPAVADAIAGQARRVATNTRYLHEAAVTLSERLLETLPDELDRIVLVNSGSEANDLAWRMATAWTGRTGAVATQDAYHGITVATIALSPDEWPDGYRPDHVEPVVPPVESRRYRERTTDAAATMAEALDSLGARGHEVAGFVFDPLFASAGILPPDGEKMRNMVERVHEAGGVVISDEVQAGFGRTGSAMWGFEEANIVPDIVTMGKPMGNGHPVAAVATRSDVLSTLRDRAEVFSTFGGNPVSSAAALAVLDEIEDRELVAHADAVGEYLEAGIERLAAEHDLIGEIRRRGLMVGVELVTDRETWTPATDEATAVIDGLRRRRVLIGSAGKNDNILKIRPPLVFEKDHADRLVSALDAVLDDVERTTQ